MFIFNSCTEFIEIPPQKAGIIVNKKNGEVDTTRVLFLERYRLRHGERVVLISISDHSQKFTVTKKFSNNLNIEYEIEVYFSLVLDKANLLYSRYENDYLDSFIIPNVKRVAENELSNYNSDKIPDSQLLEENILKLMNKAFENLVLIKYVSLKVIK